MNYDEWFESLNKNGRTTYFLGQEGEVSKEAWDYQQKKIDAVLKYINDEGWFDEYGDHHCPTYQIKELLK